MTCHSVGVSRICLTPPATARVTLWVARSTVTSPSRAAATVFSCGIRRVSARMRASSSSIANGLVM